MSKKAAGHVIFDQPTNHHRPVVTAAPVVVEPILLSRQQSAKCLGIGVRLVDVLVARGLLAAKRIGTRRLVTMESLREFVRTREDV